MSRVHIVEDHEVLKTRDAIVDTRSAGTRFAEWLGSVKGIVVVCLVGSVLAITLPALLPLTVLIWAVMVWGHLEHRPTVYFRYPKYWGHRDPKTGKAGDGILYVGNIESKSAYNDFKEIWLNDSDSRMHALILGSTGSGKSETLKGILYNALSWSSGYFVADGKADNKMPTDNYALARSFGRDDDVLVLNFLLGGSSPERIQKSRRRRTNRFNPFPAADADTIIQMGTNLLPKAEGEGKGWQEKAINLWRSMVTALVYERDHCGREISVSTFIEYLSLAKIEELYMAGYHLAQANGGEWHPGYLGIRKYLESGGCPGYQISKLLQKHGVGQPAAPAPGSIGGMTAGLRGGGRGAGNPEQDQEAFTQHDYRTNQLLPALNLLDSTYRHIFGYKRTEIDIQDVALNNRILMMLIPSLEKSAQEAENLGKLAIASLRVMMGKNLGADVEGDYEELVAAKATNSPYPFIVALDELGYYFAEGIAVMNAQARSLGFSMIALAQDVEKLTEGSRQHEANAMMANEVIKYFLRVDDVNKSADMIQKMAPKVHAAMRHDYEKGSMGWTRSSDIVVKEVDRVNSEIMRNFSQGQGLFVAPGGVFQMRTFYLGDYLKKYMVKEFWINRFVQVLSPDPSEVDAMSVPRSALAGRKQERGRRLLEVLQYRTTLALAPEVDAVIDAAAAMAESIPRSVGPAERAIALYMAARQKVLELQAGAPAPVASDAGLAGEQGQDTAEGVWRKTSAPEGEDPESIDPHQAGSSSSAGAQADAADPEDPLAFLSVPFQRKPIEKVFPQPQTPGQPEAIPALRSAPMRTVASEISVEAPPSGDEPAEAAATAEEAAPAVHRTPKTLSDLSDAVYAGEAEGATATGRAPAAGDGADAADAGDSLGSAGAGPARPNNTGEPAAVEKAESEGVDVSWIRLALQQSTVKAGALAMQQRGGDAPVEVVGLTDKALASAAALEGALGAPEDEAQRAASVIERVVSDKVTPDSNEDDDRLGASERINELLNAVRNRQNSGG
jgi:intracellular multiplication protein IcmO